MDIWSAKSRASFLCITVHYLVYDKPDTKQGITLMSSILAFHKLQGEHSGENIAHTVTDLLRRAGIDPAQVSYFFSFAPIVNNLICIAHSELIGPLTMPVTMAPLLRHFSLSTVLKSRTRWSFTFDAFPMSLTLSVSMLSKR